MLWQILNNIGFNEKESKIYLDDQSMQESEWNQIHSTTKRLESIQLNKNALSTTIH